MEAVESIGHVWVASERFNTEYNRSSGLSNTEGCVTAK